MKLEELHEEAISGGIEMHLLAHDFTGNMETNSLNIKQNALTEMIIEVNILISLWLPEIKPL